VSLLLMRIWKMINGPTPVTILPRGEEWFAFVREPLGKQTWLMLPWRWQSPRDLAFFFFFKLNSGSSLENHPIRSLERYKYKVYVKWKESFSKKRKAPSHEPRFQVTQPWLMTGLEKKEDVPLPLRQLCEPHPHLPLIAVSSRESEREATKTGRSSAFHVSHDSEITYSRVQQTRERAGWTIGDPKRDFLGEKELLTRWREALTLEEKNLIIIYIWKKKEHMDIICFVKSRANQTSCLVCVSISARYPKEGFWTPVVSWKVAFLFFFFFAHDSLKHKIVN
jgi:hypothetical protein